MDVVALAVPIARNANRVPAVFCFMLFEGSFIAEFARVVVEAEEDWPITRAWLL